MKKILPVLKPIIRGVVKTIPFGNTAVEIADNIKAEKDAPKPHNWYSIAMQILGIGAIVYAFATKMITIQELLDMIGFGK